MIVLVCGSRTWTDADTIRRRIGQLRGDHGDIVITGGAPGADSIAATIAYRLGLHVATMLALWHVHDGKDGGPIHSAALLRLRPDLVLAFTCGTRGAQDTIDRARAAGVFVEVHGWEAT